MQGYGRQTRLLRALPNQISKTSKDGDCTSGPPAYLVLMGKYQPDKVRSTFQKLDFCVFFYVLLMACLVCPGPKLIWGSQSKPELLTPSATGSPSLLNVGAAEPLDFSP